MTTLCELAKRLPDLVGTLLDSESKLKRGRFREETLTDTFTASLAAFAGPNLVIEYPPEAKTGGDLDLDFWHMESGEWLGLRIQAKRLNAEWDGGKLVPLEARRYNELLHRVQSTNELQFETLIRSSYLEERTPLYMFYNHSSVTNSSQFAGCKPTVAGINLAFAQDVAAEMQLQINAKSRRRKHQRLSHLQPYFFLLDTILCPTGCEAGGVPSPQDIYNSLQEPLRSASDLWPHEELARRLAHRIFHGGSPRTTRSKAGRIEDGPAIRVNPELETPRITFISGRIGDERRPEVRS